MYDIIVLGRFAHCLPSKKSKTFPFFTKKRTKMVSLRLLLWFLDFNSTFNVDVDFFSLQAFSIAGIAGDLLTTPAGLNGKILGIPG